MRYRKLGKTGIAVSVIGFGGSPLGNLFGGVPVIDDATLVGTAIDCGINFFDVSPYYGLGLAEERLGAALGSHRNEVILATKCGRYGADSFDFSAATITERLEDSLRRLRTDAVDILQAHDVEFGDTTQVLEETIPALVELKRQGKTRFIGITGYWPGLLSKLATESSVDTVLNYCHSNLFADDMDEALTPLAQSSGFGLINASPLHMGLLSGKPVPEWHPAPLPVRDAAARVVAFCKRRHVDPGTLALWTCLQHPVAASTLVGLADKTQITESCAALEFLPEEDFLSEVRAIIAPIHNTFWPQGRIQNEYISGNDRVPHRVQ
jgi:L-galactose dehydrogenase